MTVFLWNMQYRFLHFIWKSLFVMLALIPGFDGNECLAQHWRLWGATYEGGVDGVGVIYRYDYVHDTLQVVYSFDRFSTKRPSSGVLVDSAAQKIYGSCTAGGRVNVSKGGIFSYDLVTDSFKIIYDCYGAAGGESPVGAPVQTKSDEVWGTDMYGGAHSYGTIYSLNLTTGLKQIRKSFWPFQGTGYDAYQSPTFVNGKAYGLTHGSTSSGAGLGVLYEFDTASNTYTVKRQLTGVTGNQPQGRMVLHGNGRLYGTTTTGGLNGRGTFFEYDPVTDTFIIRHHFQNANTGGVCTGMLMVHPNGQIYGLASNGGLNGAGTLFAYDTATKTLSKKADLADSSGSYPLGGLTLARNGKMYAVTNMGGSAGGGTLMEYDPSTNAISGKLSFTGANGYKPYYVVMTEAWTNDAPVMTAQLLRDSLCMGGTDSVTVVGWDADGDTLQPVLVTSDTTVMPMDSLQVKYVGNNQYRIYYHAGNNIADTGSVRLVMTLKDAYGAVSKDSLVVDLQVVDCRVVSTGLGSAKKSETLRIHPNPADDFIEIQASALVGGVRVVRVTNAVGSNMEVPVVAVGGGYRLNIAELPAGAYQVVVEGNSGVVLSGRVVKR
jgi:uncharacterized repeat protein (TIGR03803 family)